MPDVQGKHSKKQEAALPSLFEIRPLSITKLLCHHLRTEMKPGGMSHTYQARECVWGQSREREQAFIYCLSIILKGRDQQWATGARVCYFGLLMLDIKLRTSQRLGMPSIDEPHPSLNV